MVFQEETCVVPKILVKTNPHEANCLNVAIGYGIYVKNGVPPGCLQKIFGIFTMVQVGSFRSKSHRLPLSRQGGGFRSGVGEDLVPLELGQFT